MPTIKPRINLTVSPELYALVSDLSQLEGRSRSAIICDVLEAAMLPLQAVRDVLRRASSIKGEELAALEARLVQAQEGLQPVVEDLFKLMSKPLPSTPAEDTTGDLFEAPGGDFYPHLLIGGSEFDNPLKNNKKQVLQQGGKKNAL